MENFSFNSLVDLQIVADNFGNCPKGSRLLVAKKLINRLNDLKGTITITKDNPLCIYRCDRFVIKNEVLKENPFEKYYDYLRDSQSWEFNKCVFDDINEIVSGYTSNMDIVRNCKMLNSFADKLMERCSGLGGHLHVLSGDVDIIANHFLNGSDITIVENAIDEIEYMLNTGAPNYYVIKRHLLPVMLIKRHSLYNTSEYADVNERLEKLYGTEIEPLEDPFNFFRRGNHDDAIEQYMRMQKREYEQTFVDHPLYDRTYEDNSSIIKLESIESIYEVIKNNPKYGEVTTSDIFRLEKNGFLNIEDRRPGTYNYKARLTAYKKNGVVYLIRKPSDKDNVYYFISKNKKGETKVRSVTIKPVSQGDIMERMNSLAESAVSNIKMNGR